MQQNEKLKLKYGCNINLCDMFVYADKSHHHSKLVS